MFTEADKLDKKNRGEYEKSIKALLDKRAALDQEYGIIPDDDFFYGADLTPIFYGSDSGMYVPQIDENPIIEELPDTGCQRMWAMWDVQDHSYFPMKCGAWICPPCAKIKKMILYRRLRNSEIVDWSIKTHVVITCADKESDKNIDKLFHNFITYFRRGVYCRAVKRKPEILNERGFPIYDPIIIPKRQHIEIDRLIYKPNLKYFWVKEFQPERFLKNGEWFRHFHIVFNDYVSKYDVIPIWNHVTGVDFNYVYSGLINAWDNGTYLLKYLTKAEFQILFEPKERRFQASHGVLPPVEVEKDTKREYIRMTLEQARELYRRYLANKDGFDAHFDAILMEVLNNKELLNKPLHDNGSGITLEEFDL